MKLAYPYIEFEFIERKTKTMVYRCLNKNSGEELGVIKWYPPWRQYCFLTSCLVVLSKGCMEDINDFITQLIAERKKDAS
jgi:hypothetical protein